MSNNAPRNSELEKEQVELQHAYDQLNQCWQDAEAQVAACHIPNTVHADPSPNGDVLAWAWAKGAYRVCIGVKDTADGEYDYRPVLECSVTDRLAFIEFFPCLLARCQLQVPNVTQKITQKVLEFKKFL